MSMRKAQVENGIVINVIEVDPNQIPDFCADWPEADQAGPGWTFDGDTFAAPSAPPITATEATAAVLLAIAMVEEALTAGVPLSEKLSWSAKESAARNLLAGTSAPKDMELLAGETTITGETVEDLARSVVARADQYRFAVSRLAGIRRAATASIASARSAADLEQAVALAQAQCGAIIEAANGV